MPGSKVLMIGNCVVDEVMMVDHYPAADTEVRAGNRITRLGGNACNSALMLARLQHDVSLVASLAGDDREHWIRDELRSAGVSDLHCTSNTGYRSPLSTIWLDQSSGSRTIVHHRDLPELRLRDLAAIDFRGYDWIHCEGRNVEVLSELLPGLTGSTVPLSLEIEKPRAGIEALIRWCDLVIVSSHYLREKQLEAEQCLRGLQPYNPDASFVVTLGRDGLVAMDAKRHMIKLPAYPVDHVVDSTGAGDCFIAALISARLHGEDFTTALEFAARIAANKIQKLGMNTGDIHD